MLNFLLKDCEDTPKIILENIKVKIKVTSFDFLF